MHFVDGNRPGAIRTCGAVLHPRFVLPTIAGNIAHDRGLLGRVLRAKAHWIGFVTDVSVCAGNLIFVERTFTKTGQKYLPDACVASRAHRMPAAIPHVEITDDADTLGIRRPDSKMHAAGTCVRGGLGA